MLTWFSGRKKRRSVSAGLKYGILVRQKFKCKECHEEFNARRRPSIDHFDGNRSNNKPSNLRASCANCHAVRTSKQNSARTQKRQQSRKSDPFGVGNVFDFRL